MKTQKLPALIEYYELDERVNVNNYRHVAVKVHLQLDILKNWIGRPDGYDYDEDEDDYHYHETINFEKAATDLEYYNGFYVMKSLYYAIEEICEDYPTSISAGTWCALLLIAKQWDSFNIYTERINDVVDERFEFLKMYKLMTDIAHGRKQANKLIIASGVKELGKVEYVESVFKEILRYINSDFNKEKYLYEAEYILYNGSIPGSTATKSQALRHRRNMRFCIINKLNHLLSIDIRDDRERYFFIHQLLGCVMLYKHKFIPKNNRGKYLADKKCNAIRAIEKLYEDRNKM